MMDLIQLIATVLVAVSVPAVGGYLALRGTKTTDQTDRLSKAAGLYSDYADKMNVRVENIEAKNKELETTVTELLVRVDKSEVEATQYKTESRQYKKLITEVIQWVTELLDWETRDYAAPMPHYTLSMILAHLTKAIQDEDIRDKTDKRQRGS